MLIKSHLGPELHCAGIEFFLNITITEEVRKQRRDRECKYKQHGKISDMCIVEKEKVSKHLIV